MKKCRLRIFFPMLCSKLATTKSGQSFPCGQCKNCRINHRRAWQARLLLEAASHDSSIFVTLTFRDTGTPEPLRRSSLKLFTAALASFHPFRYFAAGEYGTKGGRAHFHIHIFSKKPFYTDHIKRCWPFGDIHIGNTEPASLDYALGYLLKSRKEIRWPIEKRFPEFRAFSQGLGKFAIPHLLIDGTEIPREFRVFGRHWPIPRYLRDRAKKQGYTVSDRPAEILSRLETAEMRALLSNQKLSSVEIQKFYDDYWKKQETKKKLIRDKAIRDAYREKLNHQMRIQNETL